MSVLQVDEILYPTEVSTPLVVETDKYTVAITSTEEVRQTKAGSKKVRLVGLDIDNIDKGRRLKVFAHPNGLVAEYIPRQRYIYKAQEDRMIIPGQYTDIEAVASFLVTKAEIPEVNNGALVAGATATIVQQLRNSGLWEARGTLKWRNVPPDFFKVVSISDFGIGTVKSYYQWWLSALLKKAGNSSTKGKWFVKDNVHQDVEKGLLPDKINAIKYWNLLSFEDLMTFVARGYSGKKGWGQFIMQVRAPFDKFEGYHKAVMLKHNDWADIDNFDTVVEYLGRLPKTASMAQALNSLINSGLTIAEILDLNITTAREAQKAANYSVKFQAIYRQNRRHLNSNYVPPVLKNVLVQTDDLSEESNKQQPPPEPRFMFKWNPAYVWADSITFPSLGDQAVYNNCISRSNNYEDKILEGHAHALYALDHTPANQGGVCAFITIQQDSYRPTLPSDEYTPEGELVVFSAEEQTARVTDWQAKERRQHQRWYLSQYRSFNNQAVSDVHTRYVQMVVEQMNLQMPGASPEVKEISREELIAELSTDAIGAKIQTLWNTRPR